ncbi:ABC transporter ATP-binding protein (plasmid) [Variovorax paradoxus]|nr:ABC transporter ATP-binding protein [Variovorax paradoxus]
MFSFTGVNAFYGDSHVLHDIELKARSGRALALLGRNGAGKSTCLSTAIGFVKARTGRILLDGKDMRGLAPEAICRAGVGLVPQGRRVFPTLSVRENLEVAQGARQSPGATGWTLQRVFDMFPRLKERHAQLAGSLSGGEQQMLAIGRALMTQPRVLLLDEPSEGLAPQIVRQLATAFILLKSEMAVVLVEQNLNFALEVADDIVLLNTGRVVFSGDCEAFMERRSQLYAHLAVA